MKKCRNAYNNQWRRDNRDRTRLYYANYRDKYPEKIKRYGRDHHCKKKYGLTVDEYESLLDSHNGKCAVCARPFKDRRDSHLDHCHTTGRIRKFLCRKCNCSEGFLETSEIAYKIYEYMKDNESTIQRGCREGLS